MNDKLVTIKDISKALNVSPTTVYKALQNKPKVSDATRQRVIEKAREMKYKPNKLASALARNTIVLGIILPKHPEKFFRYVKQGITAAMSQLQEYNVKIHMHEVDDQVELAEAFRQLAESNLDGLVLSATDQTPSALPLLRMINRHIPIATLVSRTLDETPIIADVHSDGNVLGALAAQLFELCLPPGSLLAVLVPDADTSIHTTCANGFQRAVSAKGFLSIQDKTTLVPDIVYDTTVNLFQKHPDIAGVYVATYHANVVCQALNDIGRTDVRVVGHDLHPELAACLENGSLMASLFQNQFEQVRIAIDRIFRYLTEKREPFEEIHLRPEIVMRSNLGCYEGHY